MNQKKKMNKEFLDEIKKNKQIISDINNFPSLNGHLRTERKLREEEKDENLDHYDI